MKRIFFVSQRYEKKKKKTTLITLLYETAVSYKSVIRFFFFPKRQILDSPKLKEFADDNFKFDENGRKFSKQVENTVGKGEIARYEQFPPSVLKRLVLQTCKNQGLFGNGLTIYQNDKFLDCTKFKAFANDKHC